MADENYTPRRAGKEETDDTENPEFTKRPESAGAQRFAKEAESTDHPETTKNPETTKKTVTSSTRRSKPTKQKLTRKQKVKRFFTIFGITVLSLLLIGTAGTFLAYELIKLPDPNADFQSQTTFIYYNDSETKMANLAIQNRIPLEYEEMPEVMKDAVIAAENRTFWTDPGISVAGIVRSGFSILGGGEIQGGSTITQQYIKILYLNSERTVTRKFKELLLAVKMNREVPKEEILEGYLNTIYFGRGAYGVEAASRAYFNISASELTVPQAAVLASVINNPSLYDPSVHESNKQRLFDRYKYVLEGLLEMEEITDAEYKEYSQALPEFPTVPLSERYGGPNGFIVKEVEKELANIGFTETQIFGGGLHVTTTIDKKIQDQTVATATEYTEKIAKDARPAQDPDELHLAIATIDTNNGAVLAMYGGADFVQNSRNWATTPRMSASTFKAYALAAGLRHGFGLNSMFNGNTFTPPGDSEVVRNEFHQQYGMVTLRKATASSVNTAFVDMTLQIPNGPSKVVQAANDAGVPTGAGWDLNGRIALGTAEVSPIDNAAGFAAFANGGKQVGHHFVAKVTDSRGNVLYEFTDEPKQTIEPSVASDVNIAMSAVVSEGTGARVSRLGHEIAGKTGTAGVEDEIQSAWFVAYTRNYCTAVMFVVGDSGTGDLDPYKRPGDGTFYGGTYPAMVWADIMKVVLEGEEKVPFDEVSSTPSVQPSAGEATPTPTETETPLETETPEPSPTQTPTAEPTPDEPTAEPTTPTTPTSTPPTASPSESTEEPTSESPTPKKTKER